MSIKENKLIIRMQKNEITEHFIYLRLAELVSEEHNKNILKIIAHDEKSHYDIWHKITGKDIAPSRMRIFFYTAISRILGLAFGLRLMERGEGLAMEVYRQLSSSFPEISRAVILDEQKHEAELIGMLNDVRLDYASSVVLGLNDALIEFTGTLAGLTLAMQDRKLIGMTGFILGFAASLSMAASEYLSTKESEESIKSPLKSAVITGFSYLITVILLTLPYWLFTTVFQALPVMLIIAVFIILLYTFYISTARSSPFWPRFWGMSLITMGVAMVSFLFGWMIKEILNHQ